MWQKARIIDPDFEPAFHRGSELWVQGQPFHAQFHELKRTEKETLPAPNTDLPVSDGRWMLTNLGFPNGQHVRVWMESIELLNAFSLSVPFIDVNTGKVIKDSVD